MMLGATKLDIWRAKWAGPEAINARQHRRLTDLLAFARLHSPVYRERFADIAGPGGGFAAIPPVTKATLMDRFDDVVTDPAVTRAGIDTFLADQGNIGRRYRGRYPVWTTSGTTGDPGVFVQDELSLMLVRAVPRRWTAPALLTPAMLARLVRNGMHGAEIAVTGGHFAGAAGIALIQRESRFLGPRIRMISPKRQLDDLVDELNAWQPAFITGYSTVLVELARAQRQRRLLISPAMIVVSGEAISTDSKRELRQVFGCVVREMYGATEAVPLAVECDRGSVHLNSDWFVLEPVDSDYRPVELGEMSHTVLLTHLGNRVQPLIRYDLGDSVRMRADPCRCASGFPVIEVEGRQGDVLWFRGPHGRQVPIFPLALTSVVEAVPSVTRCQIVRTGELVVEVRFDLVADADRMSTWSRVRDALQRFFVGQGVPGVTIEQAVERPARNPRSDKFRHVWTERRAH